jgi:enoyl-CoA hydratase/carnithine racemase
VTTGRTPTVRVERDGAVARVVLSRPQRHNAQTPAMWHELAAAGEALAADPTVRAAVLAGDGDSFSSGIDLAEMRPGGFLARAAAADGAHAHELVAEAQAAVTWIPAAPFPVVAAVRGVALGAGAQLALACDVRIIADDARLAFREITLGAVPDLGATVVLPRLVGLERALDLMLTGRELTGAEAAAQGLALRAVPDGEVHAAAAEYARELTRAPRAALAAIKAATLEPVPQRSFELAAEGQLTSLRAMSAASPTPGVPTTNEAP